MQSRFGPPARGKPTASEGTAVARSHQGHHWYRWCGRYWAPLILVLGLLGAMAGLAGCGAAAGPAGFFASCPSSSTGASAGPSSGAAAVGIRTVPAKVLHMATSTLVLVPVCLAGHGPYPFILDTGAAQSVVDQNLATRLHLPSTGATLRATGVSCTARAGQVRVTDWSVGDVALRPQPLASLSMVGSSGGSGIAGLLGSDVWSRFGRFQLNYRSGQVTLPGPEQATVSTSAPTPLVPTPSAPTPSAPGVPMAVLHSRLGTLAMVPVTLDGHGPLTFILDTGSSQSVVDRAVAQRLGLPMAGRARQVSGVSCAAAAQPVHVTSWQLDTVGLAAQNLDSIALAIPGLNGLMGSDVLYRFGTITIDYAASRLVIGG
jgi:predicted aspartyl protease